jgi:hypothetical protein
MTYLEKDLWYFVNLAPTLALSTPKRALRYLGGQSERLVEMHGVLAQYPHLQIDNLDFWYRTLRSLGMLDTESLRGLLTQCTWRGVIWGGWLTLLLPRNEYLPILKSVPEFEHENEWAARSAVEEIENRPLEGRYEEMRRMARKCRHYVKHLPIVAMPLRKQPSHAQKTRIEADRERVIAAYRYGGVDAAKAVIRDSCLGELIADYPTWYRKTKGLELRRDYLRRWMI